MTRRPATIGGMVYIACGVITVIGLLITALGPWRRGIVVVGIAFLAAAGARTVLNENDAGMLRVRTRWFDVTLLTTLGVVLILLAANIPDQD